MERNLPIIIEERNMPIDDYKLENKSAGFSNIIFLGSMIATSIMWLIIIYICR
mgnify:CR=1